MSEVQDKLHADPTNVDLSTAEKTVAVAYRVAQENLLSFLHQIAKLHWLEKGDENSKAFYQSIKQRRKYNTIHSIQIVDGVRVNTPKEVQEEFMIFYRNLFCSKKDNRSPIKNTIMDRGPRLSDAHKNQLSYSFTLADVKRVLDDIRSNKLLGWMDSIVTFINVPGTSLRMTYML